MRKPLSKVGGYGRFSGRGASLKNHYIKMSSLQVRLSMIERDELFMAICSMQGDPRPRTGMVAGPSGPPHLEDVPVSFTRKHQPRTGTSEKSLWMGHLIRHSWDECDTRRDGSFERKPDRGTATFGLIPHDPGARTRLRRQFMDRGLKLAAVYLINETLHMAYCSQKEGKCSSTRPCQTEHTTYIF